MEEFALCKRLAHLNSTDIHCVSSCRDGTENLNIHKLDTDFEYTLHSEGFLTKYALLTKELWMLEKGFQPPPHLACCQGQAYQLPHQTQGLTFLGLRCG